MPVSVSYLIKQAFLEQLYDDAVESGDTLLVALKAFRKARLTTVKGGRFLTATLGNGHRSEFSVQQDFTQTDALELAQDLINRYGEAVTELGGSPTDSSIKDEMIDHIQPPLMVRDYSGMHVDPYDPDNP